VEQCRFVFWELLKILALAFTSLLAAKAVASLRPAQDHTLASRLVRAKPWLYVLILALVGFGAWNLGYDIAAEVYYWVSLSDMQNSRLAKAYLNSSQAVVLRPGVPRYWTALESAKLYLRQFASVADDLQAMQRVTGGDLNEVDSYRFAVCLFFLGRYDEALSITERVISQNRFYLPPYVLQGEILTAQRKYGEAQQAFALALQLLPTDQAAVEGLAHADFLAGNRQQALKVLERASKLPFSIEAQNRFEALKGLYGQ
jgi:tetratricopeptide (TPR) repeat protein